MKKLLTLCLLLAACGAKQKPQTVNFSNDTIAGNWYYDSASNTLRVEKDTSTEPVEGKTYYPNGVRLPIGNFAITETKSQTRKRTNKLFHDIPPGTVMFNHPHPKPRIIERIIAIDPVTCDTLNIMSAEKDPDCSYCGLQITGKVFFGNIEGKAQIIRDTINKRIRLGTKNRYDFPGAFDKRLHYLDSLIRIKYPLWPYVLDPPQSRPSQQYLDSIGYYDLWQSDTTTMRHYDVIVDTPSTIPHSGTFLLLGHHGYAAYQRCDTCRLVVLDSAATINALFYLLNRQFKTKQ